MSHHHLSPLVGEDAKVVEELLNALNYLNYARAAAFGDDKAKVQKATAPILALVEEFNQRNA